MPTRAPGGTSWFGWVCIVAYCLTSFFTNCLADTVRPRRPQLLDLWRVQVSRRKRQVCATHEHTFTPGGIRQRHEQGPALLPGDDQECIAHPRLRAGGTVEFPPRCRSVREMLREKIARCDAVIHVAGEVYGAEPRERDPALARRSYTQMEYEIARELKKPVYVFICGAGFPYDPHEPEDEALRALQLEHRQRLQKGNQLYTSVGNRDELALRVHALQTRVEQLGRDLSRSRVLLARGVAIGLALIALLAGGFWMLEKRTVKTEARVATLETELDKQRRWIKAVSDAYDLQRKQAGPNLTDEERFKLAVESVAKKEGVKAEDLESAIDLFVAAVRANPDADLYDRALADFAEKKFAQAATDAGLAADEAKKQRLANEQLAEKAKEQADAARNKERDARILQVQSFAAVQQYEKAAEAAGEALAITSRQEMPAEWAYLTLLQANSLDDWSEISTGADIGERRARAFAAYKAALEVATRETQPRYWEMIQASMGNALRNQALAGTADEAGEGARAGNRRVQERPRGRHAG